MRRSLGAPFIDLDEAELDEILEWVERVKYRALYRECEELQELGLKVYTQHSKWHMTFTAGYMTRAVHPEHGESYVFDRYSDTNALGRESLGSNRKPGDKWSSRKYRGKPATDYEYVGTFRVIGSAINPEGNWETFIAEDMDVNSFVPLRSEYDALAVGVGEAHE